MVDRVVEGAVPRKHHLAFRDADGALLYEEAYTRAGFEGPYTLSYHRGRPHAVRPAGPRNGPPPPRDAGPRPLSRSHLRTQDLPPVGGAPFAARIPLLFSEDLVISLATPDAPDPTYVSNGDADQLLFVHEGGGLLRSPLGDLRLEHEDWGFVPRGLLHRILPDSGPQRWLVLEANQVRLPPAWRNPSGQLRMDAPVSHRDFRRPAFRGPIDEGIRELVVKRGGAYHGFALDASPLDVVGWDGALYPFALPILCFQPRVGQVHLPPIVHGTFAMRGALACSFVPRPLDFHPEAIPCPYPHASVDVDEVIFYSRGSFTSRRGVGRGSISLHPAGVMHGPHPGAYEGSIGALSTDELAVMLDCERPLRATPEARGVEDLGYEASFSG